MTATSSNGFVPPLPSNSLAVMHGLMLDCRERRVLGPDVDIQIHSIDEDNTRVRPDQIVKMLRNRRGLVVLVGVQSNQFPRALDIARPLRACGDRCLPWRLPRLGDTFDARRHYTGIAGGARPRHFAFAGEAEEHRLDRVLRDAWNNRLQPVYNYLDNLPSLGRSAGADSTPARTIRGTIGQIHQL